MLLLRTKALSGRWLRRVREASAEVSRAVIAAREAGMQTEAMHGLYTLSIIQHEQGDFSGAHDTMLRTVEASRGAGGAIRFRQLTQTARCLALIERDLDQARAMLEEAATLAPDYAKDFHWCCADALLRAYFEEPDADVQLECALVMARREEDRWGEVECLMVLVQRAIDRGDPVRALAWGRELAPVAAKMTEGIEGAVADALEAVARLASAVPGADGHVERAVARLREVDAKGMLAYVLVAAADIDLLAGRRESAERRAQAALTAAGAVQRRTLVAASAALLAELALANGDRAGAAARLEGVAADAAAPGAISERVRARVRRVSAETNG
jgi:hypothetical protein